MTSIQVDACFLMDFESSGWETSITKEESQTWYQFEQLAMNQLDQHCELIDDTLEQYQFQTKVTVNGSTANNIRTFQEKDHAEESTHDFKLRCWELLNDIKKDLF